MVRGNNKNKNTVWIRLHTSVSLEALNYHLVLENSKSLPDLEKTMTADGESN